MPDVPLSAQSTSERKLSLEIDDAVRRGLVAWEDSRSAPYPLTNWRRSGISDYVREAVLDLLATPEQSVEDVAAYLRENGGIMRVSEFASLHGRLVTEETLAAAKALLDDADASDQKQAGTED